MPPPLFARLGIVVAQVLALARRDLTTQQNAALAEERAASATALSDQIGRLNALVARFRTGDDVAPQRHSAPVLAWD